MNTAIDIVKLRRRIQTMAGKARKLRKASIFEIATAAFTDLEHGSWASERETDESLALALMITSTDGLDDIVRAVDGAVDYVMVDAEPKRPGFSALHERVLGLCRKSRVLSYKPNDFTVEALDALLSELSSGMDGKVVAVLGFGNLGAKIGLKLAERGAEVRAYRRNAGRLKQISDGLNALLARDFRGRIVPVGSPLDAVRGAHVTIGATSGIPVVTAELVNAMAPGAVVVDAGTGTIHPGALEIQGTGARFLALNARPGYEGAIKAIFSARRLIERMGRGEAGGYGMVSNGVIGRRGDVVVDDVRRPGTIFGVADGKGNLVPEAEIAGFSANISAVRKKMKRPSGRKP
jgi:hypothetical protein